MTRPYWKLDEHLQSVLSQIKIGEDERKRSNSVFHTELEKIKSEMKKDEVFTRLFRQFHYGGSTYEKLKISAANEFDLNIELKLPIKKNNLTVENCREVPGFVFLKVDYIDNAFTLDVTEKVRREVKKWFNPTGHMMRTKVYQWMQGVLDNAMSSYRGTIPVKRSTSGPALTLIFDDIDCGMFSVDLSPTFQFGLDNWPAPPVRRPSDIPFCARLDDKNWFAVPKSPGEYQYRPELWRISFYPFEREMMNGREQMKPIIKLMKSLRDVQDWKGISSYYLKTVFMWAQYNNDPSFWKKGLGELFILMLQDIKKHLFAGKIPFFWNKEYNLVKNLHPDFLRKVAERIQKMEKRILDHLDDRPETVLIYFIKNIPEQLENSMNTAAITEIVREGQQSCCCIA